MVDTLNWTKVLTLRPEVVASDGGVGELRTIRRAISGSEEPSQRRLKLRRRIALALGREEEPGSIRFTFPPAEEP